MDYRRLIYTSVARGDDPRADRVAILGQSRANNGLNGITGVLWADDVGYLQVLEGAPDVVAATFARISGDERHSELHVLSDTLENKRVFSDWSMASLLRGETDVELQTRLGRLLRSAPDEIKAKFQAVATGAD